jgi:ferredoxin
VRVQAERNRCEGHGLCADTAPEVYELDEDAVVVVLHEHVPPALERPAEAGARVSRRGPAGRGVRLREIVVVGGSIAALPAVQTLRMEGFDGAITDAPLSVKPPRKPFGPWSAKGGGGPRSRGRAGA